MTTEPTKYCKDCKYFDRVSAAYTIPECLHPDYSRHGEDLVSGPWTLRPRCRDARERPEMCGVRGNGFVKADRPFDPSRDVLACGLKPWNDEND